MEKLFKQFNLLEKDFREMLNEFIVQKTETG